jgi:hypothetical protein
VPIASVNAYHSAGNFHTATNVSDYEAAYSYCANPSTNLYREDDYYDYDAPRCLLHSEDELVQKATGAVHYTTAYIEKIEYAWPCGTPDNTKIAACASAASGIQVLKTGQCYCQVKQTVYPVGVEEFDLAFYHSVAVATPKFRSGLGDLEITETVFEGYGGAKVQVRADPCFAVAVLADSALSFPVRRALSRTR